MSSPVATLAPRLIKPLPDIAAWTAYFRSAGIPVLTDTAEALEALRLNEDKLDANGIGELISNDPLMTLKVMSHVALNRSSRVVTDTETVISALVLLGISPFFRAFGTQPTVEERLADKPEA